MNERTDKLLKVALSITIIGLIIASYSAVFSLSKDRADLVKKNQELDVDFQALINTPMIQLDRLQFVAAEQNVFKVTVQIDGHTGGGTGYLVSSSKYGTVLLTNKHICDMNPEGDLFLVDQDTGASYVTKMQRKGVKTDLCLLDTPAELKQRPIGLQLANVDRRLDFGEMLYIYGHPSLRKLTASRGPFVNISWLPVTPLEQTYLQTDHLNIGRADVAIYPGSSGSPVLDKDGFVVGTIFACEIQTNVALFIPLQDMYKFLDGAL